MHGPAFAVIAKKDEVSEMMVRSAILFNIDGGVCGFIPTNMWIFPSKIKV